MPTVVHEPVLVPVAKLRPNPDNPKKAMGPTELAGLRECVKRYGFAGVLNVAVDPDDTYCVLDGNTRLEELQAADVKNVFCIIHESMAHTVEDHSHLRREFLLSYDKNRKIFDKDKVIAQLKELAAAGRDIKALGKLTGLATIGRIVGEKSVASAADAVKGMIGKAKPMESMVLYGPSEDITEIRRLVKELRGRFTTTQKIRAFLEQSDAHLEFDDEGLATIFLATLARYQKAMSGGEEGGDA